MNKFGEREMLALVEPRFGTAELAREWYDQVPLPGLSDKTAAQLVKDGRGEDVVEFIRAVDAGVHA
jgi:hypothetical protein